MDKNELCNLQMKFNIMKSGHRASGRNANSSVRKRSEKKNDKIPEYFPCNEFLLQQFFSSGWEKSIQTIKVIKEITVVFSSMLHGKAADDDENCCNLTDTKKIYRSS